MLKKDPQERVFFLFKSLFELMFVYFLAVRAGHYFEFGILFLDFLCYNNHVREIARDSHVIC